MAPRLSEPTNSEAANDFREDMIRNHLEGGGRDGWNYVVDTLFEISDLVLNNQHNDHCMMARIRAILSDAMMQSDSEMEEAAAAPAAEIIPEETT